MPKGTCSVDGCEKPVKGRGWCGTHYAFHFRTGTLEESAVRPPVASPPCSIERCDSPAKSRGMCIPHYQRWWRNGSPEGLKRMQQPRNGTLWQVFSFYMPGDPPLEGVVWPWAGEVSRAGYGRLRVNGKRLLAHRASYELFIGPIPAGHVVRHKNDTPDDVNPCNLEVGTHWDNINDRRERGRAKPGEEHHMHKLTEGQVREIRHKRNKEGRLLRVLSAEYGIAIATVSDIARYKIWQHLSD